MYRQLVCQIETVPFFDFVGDDDDYVDDDEDEDDVDDDEDGMMEIVRMMGMMMRRVEMVRMEMMMIKSVVGHTLESSDHTWGWDPKPLIERGGNWQTQSGDDDDDDDDDDGGDDDERGIDCLNEPDNDDDDDGVDYHSGGNFASRLASFFPQSVIQFILIYQAIASWSILQLHTSLFIKQNIFAITFAI